jgi:hypothetical protein
LMEPASCLSLPWMEAITVTDEDVARYVGRKLKVNLEDVEFIGTVSGWVDINNQPG